MRDDSMNYYCFIYYYYKELLSSFKGLGWKTFFVCFEFSFVRF